MRKPLLLTLLALACVRAAAEPPAFSGLDLSGSDRLLLAASARSPEAGPFSTLLLAEAATRGLRQLTFFPEGVLLLDDGQVLQVHNRFGVFRSGPGLRGLAPVTAFPSFVGGSPVAGGSIAPMGASPGGRHLLYLRPRSAAWGELAIQEVSSGQETVISSRVELSLRELPAAWSPDGRFLVYAKGSSLYYFSLSQLETGRVPAEGLRRIGEGRMASVQWGADRGLYYVSGRAVSLVDPTELFTRALYSGLLAIGRVVGQLPYEFDPLFDSFHVSPDGRQVLLAKAGRELVLAPLAPAGPAGAGDPVQLPHLSLPRGASVRTVAWTAGAPLTLLCRLRAAGKPSTAVYRLVSDAQGAPSSFARTADEGVRDIVLSPDGSLAALVRADEVSWKDAASWQERGRTAHPAPLHVLWLSADELLIAGAQYIERWSIPSSRSALVALSQPGEYGWAAAGGETVQARVDGRPFAFDEKAGTWTPAPGWAVRERSLASAGYRVFLEPSAGGPWANVPMIRAVKGSGTVPLVAPAAAGAEPFPAEDPVDFSNFAHGSRTRRREVSLVCNVVESDEGLAEVLDTLSARGIRATFFVNGEFIRRHPEAVAGIAEAGHEVGSLFYASFNLTDARLTVDAEFIRAGLARNEDDYHAATGRELSPLWHAPYYIVNSAIIEAAAAMGYLYAGRDVDPLDWVAKTDSNAARGIYFAAADLVERTAAEWKPGSIIPVQLGAAGLARDDYLFQKLDLVVSELARQGYDIVPVSTLVEHAR